MNFKFDFNEWYVLISAIILMAFFMVIRKHFSNIVILTLWIFNVVYVATIDYAVAGTPFHVYDCLDNETYEPMAAFAHVFLYTPFSFILLYFYDKLRIHGKKRIALYLLFWTSFSVFFEWVSIQAGFITYLSWNLYYSILTYPISAFILIKVYHFIQRQLLFHANEAHSSDHR
jgi:VanZ family protein